MPISKQTDFRKEKLKVDDVVRETPNNFTPVTVHTSWQQKFGVHLLNRPELQPRQPENTAISAERLQLECLAEKFILDVQKDVAASRSGSSSSTGDTKKVRFGAAQKSGTNQSSVSDYINYHPKTSDIDLCATIETWDDPKYINFRQEDQSNQFAKVDNKAAYARKLIQMDMEDKIRVAKKLEEEIKEDKNSLHHLLSSVTCGIFILVFTILSLYSGTKGCGMNSMSKECVEQLSLEDLKKVDFGAYEPALVDVDYNQTGLHKLKYENGTIILGNDVQFELQSTMMPDLNQSLINDTDFVSEFS